MTEDKNRSLFEKYFFSIVNVPYPQLLKAAIEKYPIPNRMVFENEHNILAVFKYVYFQSILVSRKFNISIKSGYDAASGVLGGIFIPEITMDAFEAIQLEATQSFEEFDDMYYPESDNNFEDKKVKINWIEVKSNLQSNRQKAIRLSCKCCDNQTECKRENSPESCAILTSSMKDIVIDKFIPFTDKTIQDNNGYGLSVEIYDTAFKIYADTIKSALKYFKVH